MRKNLGLALFLVFLLTGTYFFQEKRSEREYTEAQLKGKLLTEELKSLELPFVSAEKKDGQWWSGKTLLSHNTLKLIEERLLDLTEIKAIEGKNPEAFFNKAISLKINGVPWLIGDLSMEKDAFYISKGGKISLAVIDAASGTVSTSEENIEGKKLNELRSLLNKKLEGLTETQLFRYYQKLPFEQINVKAEGALPYELHLNKDQTTPPPISGITIHSGLSEKFVSVLTQITLKEEVPYSEKLKFKKIASITFIGAGEKNVEWGVWIKGKDSADVYVLDDDRKQAFWMIGGSLRPFFLSVQDYWDKKVIPPKSFKNFDRLAVTFREGKKEVLVTVINREPLDFEAKGFKAKPGNMQDLFLLVFNLGNFDQANRVSQLTSSEKQQYLSETHLQMELMGQNLLCLRKKDELILVNITQGFKAHFLVPFESLRCQMEDVLE